MNSAVKVVITDLERLEMIGFIHKVNQAIEDRSCFFSETTFKSLWLFWWQFDTLSVLHQRYKEWVNVYEYCYEDMRGCKPVQSGNLKTLIEIRDLLAIGSELYLDSNSARVLHLFRMRQDVLWN
jgi:hypothetical protein